MPRQPNPFRPGFNQMPAVLAGRDEILAAAREALAVAALDSRTPRPLVLTGVRGVGKTVVLGEIAAVAADEYGWLTVPAEVRASGRFTPHLIDRLTAARDLYRQTRPGDRLKVTSTRVRATVLGLSAEVQMHRRATRARPELALDAALSEVMSAAAEHDAGLVLTLDETHLASRDELAELAATLQQHVPDGWPLAVVMAGLPGLREPGRAVTYLERAEWHTLGLLDQAATIEALTGPAATARRPMTAPAASTLAAASGGYPYAIQVLGHHAWRASHGSESITIAHARAALPAAQRGLAAGLYASRWADASDREREYLEAVAELVAHEKAVTGGDVARHLGKRPSEVSYLRDRLLKKGTLYAQGRELRFPTPGMADWIKAGAVAGPRSRDDGA
jgi:hypothetical protein